VFDAELNWALGDFLSNNLFYKNTFLHIFEKSYYWMIKQTGLEWLSNNSDYLSCLIKSPSVMKKILSTIKTGIAQIITINLTITT
jgi:hypothetical protein